MILITKKNSSVSYHWSLGHASPSIHHDDIDVMYVQDEDLDIIRQAFSNLPAVIGSKTTFTGEAAKFLFLNIKNLDFKYVLQ